MKNTFDYLLESPATLPLKIAFFVFLALIVYLYVAIRTSLSKVVWRDKQVEKYQAEIISTRNDFHTTNEANLKRYAELEAERDELKRVVRFYIEKHGPSCECQVCCDMVRIAKAKERGLTTQASTKEPK